MIVCHGADWPANARRQLINRDGIVLVLMEYHISLWEHQILCDPVAMVRDVICPVILEVPGDFSASCGGGLGCEVSYGGHHQRKVKANMIMSSNGNIFRISGHLCRNSLVPAQKPVTWSFDVFFDLCLNKQLSKQSWGWWFETPSHSSWHCNVVSWGWCGIWLYSNTGLSSTSYEQIPITYRWVSARKT